MGVSVATPTLPVQAIVPDKDTWIDGDFGFQLIVRIEPSGAVRLHGGIVTSALFTCQTRQASVGSDEQNQ